MAIFSGMVTDIISGVKLRIRHQNPGIQMLIAGV
jgi:hypothetical protein